METSEVCDGNWTLTLNTLLRPYEPGDYPKAYGILYGGLNILGVIYFSTWFLLL